jgi:hypothetical protein
LSIRLEASSMGYAQLYKEGEILECAGLANLHTLTPASTWQNL